MRLGSIALARVQQSHVMMKSRPVVVLQEMPPFSDYLVCAVSSQLRQECKGFDEVIAVQDPDFQNSGLKVSSLIRLGLVATLPQSAFLGSLGAISARRLGGLTSRLAAHISGP